MSKIVVIINNLGVGGAERLAVDDINEMIRRGISVKLVTLKPEKDDGTLSIHCNIKASDWQCIKFTNLYDVASWKKLIAFLRDFEPEAVITHLWYANTIGRIAAHWAQVKKVISFEHSVYDGVKSWKQFLLDRFLQVWTTKIVAVSQAVGDSLIRHSIAKRKIVTIFNGIDISKYQMVSSPDVRAKLGLPASLFIFIYVGRLMPSKGVDVLLSALKLVPDAALIIVGEGKERETLKRLTEDLGLTPRVKFLGIRQDIPELLALSDCFVLPSSHEGLPMVLLEAMAASKPIIVTNFQASGEIINNGVDGVIVPIDQPKLLAEAMNKIKDDKELRQKISAAAKANSNRFSIAHHVEAILNLLK